MTKAQFDQVMEPFLVAPAGVADAGDPFFAHSVVAPVWECLDRAGLEPGDLDGRWCFNGRSCRNPSVRRRLLQTLHDDLELRSGSVIVDTPNLDTSVACGAALACYWKHERDIELIRPVTGEDIGILTLDNRPVCLVPSGTQLPFPDEGVHAHPSDFYVPQDGQKELIIPFYAGATDGIHRLAGIVKAPLPKGTRQGDLVKIKLTVDENKILHCGSQASATVNLPPPNRSTTLGAPRRSSPPTGGWSPSGGRCWPNKQRTSACRIGCCCRRRICCVRRATWKRRKWRCGILPRRESHRPRRPICWRWCAASKAMPRRRCAMLRPRRDWPQRTPLFRWQSQQHPQPGTGEGSSKMRYGV